MNKTTILLVSLLLVACGDSRPALNFTPAIPGSGAASPIERVLPTPRADQARIVEEKVISERLLELTIASDAFTEPTKIHVNLPAGYSTTKRWPVTYYLAGTNHTCADFNQQYGGGELTANYASIVVSPTGRSGYWSDWHNGGAFGPPRYETYVIDQLIPLIDERFSTIGRRVGRAVLGESMGGYGALMLAARHPDLFVAAASVSGAVDSNLQPNGAVLSASPALDGAEPDAIYGPRATQEVRWRGHNPYDLAENLRTLALWIGSANGRGIDPVIEAPADASGCGLEAGVYNASVSLHGQLDALGITHTWRDFGAGCHSIPNFQRQIREVLELFTATFERGPAMPTRFDHLAIEPEFSVFNWTLTADPTRALEFLHMEDASASALKLTGSGRTAVTTPPFYAEVRQVRIEGGEPAIVIPDAEGRIRFTVDVGVANTQPQYSTPVGSEVKTVTVRMLIGG